MAVKYRIEFSNRNDDDFKIEIDVPSYEGEVIDFAGVGGSPLEITHDGGSDNPFDTHVVSSQASISFVLPPEMDIEDLQLAGDLEVKVRIYKNFALFWSGFLISDGLQELYKGYNAPVTITASDGLKQLDGMDFDYSVIYPITMPYGKANDLCPMYFIQAMLRKINNELPTIWNCEIKNLQDVTRDFLAGITELDPTGELVKNHNFTCDKLLEGIIQSANLTIQQVEGKWYIQDRQLTHKDEGIIEGYYMESGTAITYAEDVNRNPTEINNDSVKMIKKAVSKVEVTYKNTRNENILPNGSFNLIGLSEPVYWQTNNGVVNISDPINGRLEDQYKNTEHSAQVESNANTEYRLESVSGMPFINFDAHTLFPRFTIGFTFMPENYPTENIDGINYIDWDEKPLWLEVAYTATRNGITEDYYLNENGFWVRDVNTNMAITSTEIREDLGYIDIVFRGAGVTGQKFTIYEYIEDVPNYRQDTIVTLPATYLTTEATIDYILTQLPFATKIGTDTVRYPIEHRYYMSPLVFVTNDPSLVTTTNQIQIIVDKLINGDVAQVQFTSKGSQGRIVIPDPGELVGVNDLGRGRMRFRFIQKLDNTITHFDDVYINVDDNNDKYILKLPALKDSKEDYELTISSSFSGFLLSSYMNDFSNSDANMLYVKNGVQATLTEHYGRDVLHWRSKPCKIFDCSFDGYVRLIDYITFYGLNFVTLSVSYNAETDITKVTMFEIKHEDLTNLEVTHEATNKDNIR